MKKLMIWVLGLLMTLTVSASELNGASFKFEYEGEQHYKLSFGSKTLTWWGIKGLDEGRSETDHYQQFKIGPSQYMVQWKEHDGTFVTVMIDSQRKLVWSSGQFQGSSWFRKGVITEYIRRAVGGI